LIRYVPEQVTAGLIDSAMALRATRQAYLAVLDSDTSLFPVVLGHGSELRNRFSIKSSRACDVAGLKIGSYWPGNTDTGRRNHNSCILLFDQDTGRIDTMVEAGLANAYRTAAGNELAVSCLARADACHLAIFGAGNQAVFECEAVMNVRSIQKISIVNRDASRAQKLAEHMAERVSEMRIVDARTACSDADIIVTATGARAPLFENGWIRPGTHISCMGADAPGKQELPVQLHHRADLYCDFLDQSAVIGEFQHIATEIRTGLLQAANLGAVLAGQCEGRRSDEAITIFDSSGLSLQDLYLARLLLAEAGARGQVVELRSANSSGA
jgi:ornithine cyclodeaminase